MGGDLMVMRTASVSTIETLKLNRGAWLINEVDILKWGTEIVIRATYDPSTKSNTDFQLIFKNCTHLYWQPHAEAEDLQETAADVIGMNVQEHQKNHKAVISTHLFEIGLEYGELIIEKDW